MRSGGTGAALPQGKHDAPAKLVRVSLYVPCCLRVRIGSGGSVGRARAPSFVLIRGVCGVHCESRMQYDERTGTFCAASGGSGQGRPAGAPQRWPGRARLVDGVDEAGEENVLADRQRNIRLSAIQALVIRHHAK